MKLAVVYYSRGKIKDKKEIILIITIGSREASNEILN